MLQMPSLSHHHCSLESEKRKLFDSRDNYRVLQVAEHFMKQNNAIDVYEPYFTGPNCGMLEKPLAPSYKTLAVISDPRKPTRSVQHISWSPDQGSLMAVSYADMGFQMATPDSSSDSFIFDLGKAYGKAIKKTKKKNHKNIANHTDFRYVRLAGFTEISTPSFTVKSPHQVVTLEFNPRDAQCLAGGLMSGQVAFWDMRKGSATAAISSKRYSHRCPARSLHWIHSKISTEFYSGSSDGQVTTNIVLNLFINILTRVIIMTAYAGPFVGNGGGEGYRDHFAPGPIFTLCL